MCIYMSYRLLYERMVNEIIDGIHGREANKYITHKKVRLFPF